MTLKIRIHLFDLNQILKNKITDIFLSQLYYLIGEEDGVFYFLFQVRQCISVRNARAMFLYLVEITAPMKRQNMQLCIAMFNRNRYFEISRDRYIILVGNRTVEVLVLGEKHSKKIRERFI